MIDVTQTSNADPFEFEVKISEGGSETRHRVTLSRDTWRQLTGGAPAPDRCVEAAFRFLLDREPKEAILPHFDIAVIGRYFPDFARELPNYLLSD